MAERCIVCLKPLEDEDEEQEYCSNSCSEKIPFEELKKIYLQAHPRVKVAKEVESGIS